MMPVMRLARWVALGVSLALAQAALAISYTVQVVAVSDNQVAFDIRNRLAAEGFPAYILTVPSPAGLIYRIRVGAFVNRAAAASFAEQMAEISGSVPTPALAESIPQGLIALEPELLSSVPLAEATVEVLPWPDGVAFRVQFGEQQATYYLPDGRTVSAWQLGFVGPQTMVRVHALPLWPDGEASEEARQNVRQATLVDIAAALQLTPAQVAAFEFQREPPFLVVAEEIDLDSGARRRMRLLGQPAGEWTARGPALLYFSGEPERDIAVPEPLLVLSAETLPALALPERVSGDGFSAYPDGNFSRLAQDGRSWRALVGAAIWAQGDAVITLRESTAYLYRVRQ